MVSKGVCSSPMFCNGYGAEPFLLKQKKKNSDNFLGGEGRRGQKHNWSVHVPHPPLITPHPVIYTTGLNHITVFVIIVFYIFVHLF